MLEDQIPEAYWTDKRRRPPHPDDAMSKTERWIKGDGGGVSRVANAVGTHYVTVYSWINRRHCPPLAAAVKLMELSQGELTARQILEDTLPW